MYHRFEENKYPSTNIKIQDFKTHLDLIEENNLKFVNPKNFLDEINNNKGQRKVELWANSVGVKVIDIEFINDDPFFNINTKKDLEKAKEKIKND